jgi:hypothetical protein
MARYASVAMSIWLLRELLATWEQGKQSQAAGSTPAE